MEVQLGLSSLPAKRVRHTLTTLMARVLTEGHPDIDVQLRDKQKQKGGKCFVSSMCVSFYVYLQEQHLKICFHLPHHTWALTHPRNCECVIWCCIIMVHMVHVY